MSIANFYFFGESLLCNEPEGLDRIPLEATEALADSRMEILRVGDFMPILPKTSLIELISPTDRNVECLMTLKNDESLTLRIGIDGIPFVIGIEKSMGGYRIFIPRFDALNRDRMAELVFLATDKSGRFQSERVSFVAHSYYNMLCGGAVADIEIGNAVKLFTRVVSVVDRAGKALQADTFVDFADSPVIRYDEKHFAQIIMLAAAVSGLMSDGNVISMSCRSTERMACFEVALKLKAPKRIKRLLFDGGFEDYSFTDEYGELFLMLCYLRHIACVYGYSVTVVEKSEATVLTVAFPITRSAEASVMFREIKDIKLIEELSEIFFGGNTAC